MPFIARTAGFACVSVLAILLAACGGQKEPAQKLLADIDATVTAASGEAAKYIPDQLAEVQTQFGALKSSYDKQDYAAVVSGAPAVLGAAKDLATTAAAKKDGLLKSLNDEWTALAVSVPDSMTAAQNRIDDLSRPSNHHLAAGLDLNAAKLRLDEAASLWSKAQAAFASGNMDEAVRTAQDVKTRVAAVAAALKLDLGAPVG